MNSKERETVRLENIQRTEGKKSGSIMPTAARSEDKRQVDASSQNVTQLPWCPSAPTVKDHQFELNLNETTHDALVAGLGGWMQNGGHFLPSTCRSREHLAIIIPYRDRERNLHVLLHNLLPFLWHQLIEFTVILVEQTAEHPFNKGVLFNAAFRELQRQGQERGQGQPNGQQGFTCYVMQDVDLIPMDNRNLYRCGGLPRHLCLTAGQTEWPEKLMYSLTFGGVIALRPKLIERVNGFSVSYYGWGLEDDDLALRIQRLKLHIERYRPIEIGKYYKQDHERMPPNPRWKELKKTIRLRQTKEGLNTLNYTLVSRKSGPLYTQLLIRVPPPPDSIYGNITKNDSVDDHHRPPHPPPPPHNHRHLPLHPLPPKIPSKFKPAP